jgi:hypothetical protein
MRKIAKNVRDFAKNVHGFVKKIHLFGNLCNCLRGWLKVRGQWSEVREIKKQMDSTGSPQVLRTSSRIARSKLED